MKKVYLNSCEVAHSQYPNISVKENPKGKTSIQNGVSFTYLGKVFSDDENFWRQLRSVFAFIAESLLVILSLGIVMTSKGYKRLLSHQWKECKTGQELIRIYVLKKLEIEQKTCKVLHLIAPPPLKHVKETSQLEEKKIEPVIIQKEFNEQLNKYSENPENSDQFLDYFNQITSQKFEIIISQLHWEQILILYTLYDRVHCLKEKVNFLKKYKDSCLKQFERSLGNPKHSSENLDKLVKLQLNGINNLAPEHTCLLDAIKSPLDKEKVIEVVFSRLLPEFSDEFLDKCINILFHSIEKPGANFKQNRNSKKRAGTMPKGGSKIVKCKRALHNTLPFRIDALKKSNIDHVLFEKIITIQVNKIVQEYKGHPRLQFDAFLHTLKKLNNLNLKFILSNVLRSLNHEDLETYFFEKFTSQFFSKSDFLAFCMDVVNATQDLTYPGNKEKLLLFLLCINKKFMKREKYEYDQYNELGNAILEKAAVNIDQFLYILDRREHLKLYFIPYDSCLQMMISQNKLEEFIKKASSKTIVDCLIAAINKGSAFRAKKISIKIFPEVKKALQTQHKWFAIRYELNKVYPKDPSLT